MVLNKNAISNNCTRNDVVDDVTFVQNSQDAGLDGEFAEEIGWTNAVSYAADSDVLVVGRLASSNFTMANNHLLSNEDEVILNEGDILQLGNTKHTSQTKNKMIRPFFISHHFRLFMLVILLLGALPLCAQRENFKAPSLHAAPAPVKKASREKVPAKDAKSKETVRKNDATTAAAVTSAPTSQPSKLSYGNMSNYELEVAASHGDIKAQTVLGARWVQSSDSIRHENGVKYLRNARNRGSQEALRILQRYNLN